MQSAPVDTASARELLKVATTVATAEEMEAIARLLEAKARRFAVLSDVDTLDAEALRELAGLVFTLRPRRRKLMADRSIDAHRDAIGDLLHGAEPLRDRFDRFTISYGFLKPHRARAFASELLHFHDPRRYWLWTPWIWDPSSASGALSMLTEASALYGGTDGAVYAAVGRATAAVANDGQSAGYTRLAGGLLGTDLFLAVAYAVSMMTVYKLRISQEFLRFMPEFPELVRRLLGVQHLEETA